ncbi:MarR family winged helix-turn-helix transcriptional regulator [Citreimonas salinaria]|uniref:Transcriptional regulator, MarR family n=1 Tax=Citreimonas salinaria TaxID=321339 RepID=A0A1H3K4N1_9RHOB|nr:MarR family transcriptional regulator [Citreimonas salinaria]SDY46819.1 transcriptional regulator, MarR family [Citreimonas salinaria]
MKPAPRPAESSPSKARLRLWLRLLKSTRQVEAVLRERLRTEFGTTLPRFDVMAALARYEDGLKMSALSGVLRVSNGNVTGIVDRLAEDGHVVRVQMQGDRRASVVRLTADGRAEFTRQAAAHAAWIDALLDDFTEAEAEALATRFDAVTTQEEKA